MQVNLIVEGAAANGSHTLTLPRGYKGQNEAVVQIEITGTATVTVNGRIQPDFSFSEVIPAVTVDTLQPISYIPELEVVISGYSSGTITVGVLTSERH